MLHNGNVVVGNYYMDSGRRIARQVLKVVDGTVTFTTYHLDNGNCTGNPSICLHTDFINWAYHEATTREISILQTRELEARLYSPQ